MTATEIRDYYAALLIVQYNTLGNALAHVQAWATAFLQNQIVDQVQSGFDLTTAVGIQLTILGLYRGIPRVIFGIATGEDWSLIPCNDPSPNSYLGWALAAGANPTWKWLQVNDLDSQAFSLTDAQLRKMIQLKAAFDSWDGTLGSLDNILYSFFTSYAGVVDNGDMTMTYQHQITDPDPNSLFNIANVAGILPHGAGISFTVQEI